MQLTIQNTFHGTVAHATPLETYTSAGDQMCAVLSYSDLARLQEELCGMSDCSCSKIPGWGVGEDDVVYAIVTESV